jgi:predicted nucleotide-binding protein (sugar kinase/HSP70/actin superfamily)
MYTTNKKYNKLYLAHQIDHNHRVGGVRERARDLEEGLRVGKVQV